MNCQATISVKAGICTGCGLCVSVCPTGTLAVRDKKAVVVGDECMQCDHCVAACPAAAIRLDALDNALLLESFEEDRDWLPHGAFDTRALVRLMRSRRSCRNYFSKPVARNLLSDLVKIGTTAPSGTNSQCLGFTILADRAAVVKLGDRVARFFRRLNGQAANPFLRFFLKLFGRPELDRYYHRHHKAVAKSLEEWERFGTDRLFHGATGAIIVTCRPGASCPREDALLAAQNILLAAHAMGLGTCLVGYVVEAMARDEQIKKLVAIPKNETVYAVIGVGYPDEKYRRVAGRKKAVIRFVV